MAGSAARFSPALMALFHKLKIIGLQAGHTSHRYIGLWVVAAEGRVFVRSWSASPGGWHMALRQNPQGVLQIGDHQLAFRAIHTRSERLKDRVDQAYREKYHTPGARQYVRDLCRPKSRNTTVELVPR